MAYFIREVTAGLTKEIEKWKRPEREALRQAKRAAKLNPTGEAQARQNRERALRRLKWDINANFGQGDYWLTFTYSLAHEPTAESCEEDYKRLIRKMRAIYKKAGAVMKYVAVCNEPERRPHIHILLKKGAPLEAIQELWGYGRIGIKLLDGSGNYRRLAEYIFRHSEGKQGKKKWNSSKNLYHPQPRERKSSAGSWREEPKAPAGWMLDKEAGTERGINPITGVEYQRYTLIKLPEKEKSKAGKARARAHVTTMRN